MTEDLQMSHHTGTEFAVLSRQMMALTRKVRFPAKSHPMFNRVPVLRTRHCVGETSIRPIRKTAKLVRMIMKSSCMIDTGE